MREKSPGSVDAGSVDAGVPRLENNPTGGRSSTRQVRLRTFSPSIRFRGRWLENFFLALAFSWNFPLQGRVEVFPQTRRRGVKDLSFVSPAPAIRCKSNPKCERRRVVKHFVLTWPSFFRLNFLCLFLSFILGCKNLTYFCLNFLFFNFFNSAFAIWFIESQFFCSKQFFKRTFNYRSTILNINESHC